MVKVEITAPRFHDEDAARRLLESLRWPNGPVCPHCKNVGAYEMKSGPTAKKPMKPGTYKCKACRKKFRVTVGTLFEKSHIPLHKWLLAFALICANKKGLSAHQLHRMLGVTYKTAWFLCHRIRFAMERGTFDSKMPGTVEADETYVGGKRKRTAKRGRPGVESHKIPVFSLVQRGGEVRSRVVDRVTAANLQGAIAEHVDTEATVCTDDVSSYASLGKRFPKHGTIDHSLGQYADGDLHTNTVESFFSLLKRGVIKAFHHVSRRHLHRYLAEFDFRFSLRKMENWERTLVALLGIEGRRRMHSQARS